MFLMTQLGPDETPKVHANVLADKSMGHSYPPTQTAFFQQIYWVLRTSLFIYYEKVNTLHILLFQAPTDLWIFPELE